uniref:Ig-like domain-containing protein n=1 Tax=Maylandia zebra TaxID=106582 RepID=A0A3P9B527_9CICH
IILNLLWRNTIKDDHLHTGHQTFLPHSNCCCSFYRYFYVNKMLLGQYNSTLGKYVGYTKKTKEIADNLNKNKGFLEHEKKNKEKCRTNIPLVLDILSRPGICSSSGLKEVLVESADSKHPGLFMCSAYNFYPKQIKLTWLKDGKEATSNVTSTDELPNGNWLYQIHSYIEISSKPGEKISCMVEHASLTEPKVYDWVPITEAGKNKIAVGAAGLLLALVFPIIGVIFYKRKSWVWVLLLPTTQRYLDKKGAFPSCHHKVRAGRVLFDC